MDDFMGRVLYGMKLEVNRPGLATYLDVQQPNPASSSSSSTSQGNVIDLVELSRRLIAQWQYIDGKPTGKFSSYEPNLPIGNHLEEVRSSLTRSMTLTGMRTPPKSRIDRHIRNKKFNKLVVASPYPGEKSAVVTRKNFCLSKGATLKSGDVDKLYWQMRLRYSCAMLNQAVGQVIHKLEKKSYAGFQLPNGKVVPFQAMSFAVMEVAPKDYTVIHFNMVLPPMVASLLQGKEMPGMNIVEPVEAMQAIDESDGPLFQHVAMCFNLPAEDEGGKGRHYIIDPSFAQFGARDPAKGLVYHGYWEDYVKQFPAEKVILKAFEKCDYIDGTFHPWGPDLVESVMSTLESPCCHYCGEVEESDGGKRRKKGKGRGISGALKKCSRCKVVAYCDAVCQKLAWPHHKLVCKESS